MESITTERWCAFFKKVFWFLGLWGLGVGGAVLLALPFKLLIRFGASF
jgi:hypothetical protein